MPGTQPTTYENRIDGASRPSRRAGRFQWRAAEAPCEVLGSFPRSGVEEVEEARAVLARGERDWSRRSIAARRRTVERGLARFAAALVDEAPLLAGGFGLEESELQPEVELCRERSRRAVREARPASPGVALVAPDWRSSLGALAASVAAELVEGRVVLLLADERAPLGPALLVEALLEGGVPTDVVALLFAPETEAREVALTCGLVAVRAWGDAPAIAVARRVASRASIPSQRLVLHRARIDRLPRGADPEAAAETVVREAFDRARTLSGARGGQLSTLYVPESDFAAFSEALMAALLDDRAYREPLPFLDPRAPQRMRAAWTLALDEGATLIAGGEVREEGRSRRVRPALLTNGGAHMRAARRVEPTPVLLLCREPLASRALRADA